MKRSTIVLLMMACSVFVLSTAFAGHEIHSGYLDSIQPTFFEDGMTVVEEADSLRFVSCFIGERFNEDQTSCFPCILANPKNGNGNTLNLKRRGSVFNPMIETVDELVSYLSKPIQSDSYPNASISATISLDQYNNPCISAFITDGSNINYPDSSFRYYYLDRLPSSDSDFDISSTDTKTTVFWVRNSTVRYYSFDNDQLICAQASYTILYESNGGTIHSIKSFSENNMMYCAIFYTDNSGGITLCIRAVSENNEATTAFTQQIIPPVDNDIEHGYGSYYFRNATNATLGFICDSGIVTINSNDNYFDDLAVSYSHTTTDADIIRQSVFVSPDYLAYSTDTHVYIYQQSDLTDPFINNCDGANRFYMNDGDLFVYPSSVVSGTVNIAKYDNSGETDALTPETSYDLGDRIRHIHTNGETICYIKGYFNALSYIKATCTNEGLIETCRKVIYTYNIYDSGTVSYLEGTDSFYKCFVHTKEPVFYEIKGISSYIPGIYHYKQFSAQAAPTIVDWIGNPEAGSPIPFIVADNKVFVGEEELGTVPFNTEIDSVIAYASEGGPSGWVIGIQEDETVLACFAPHHLAQPITLVEANGQSKTLSVQKSTINGTEMIVASFFNNETPNCIVQRLIPFMLPDNWGGPFEERTLELTEDISLEDAQELLFVQTNGNILQRIDSEHGDAYRYKHHIYENNAFTSYESPDFLVPMKAYAAGNFLYTVSDDICIAYTTDWTLIEDFSDDIPDNSHVSDITTGDHIGIIYLKDFSCGQHNGIVHAITLGEPDNASESATLLSSYHIDDIRANDATFDPYSNSVHVIRELGQNMEGDLSFNDSFFGFMTTQSNVNDDIRVLPATAELQPAYPNPFNPSTTVRFSTAMAGDVKVTICDVLGREVATLLNGHQEAGQHAIVWNGKSSDGNTVASGTYFVRMDAPNHRATQRITLIK